MTPLDRAAHAARHPQGTAMIGSIAAGVGGAGGWQALAWAAEEAERTGARLVLVHVCPPDSPLGRAGTEPSAAEVELADPALAHAYAGIQTRLGGHRTALHLHRGDPATALVGASADARLLAIGAGGTGRTARRVLRHAHCPVVVIRPQAPPDPRAPLAGHVVVGVDGSPAGRTALEFGFAQADEHHVPLAAVHVSEASHDDYFYDDVTLSTHFAVEPAALDLLATETEPLAADHPAVPVRRAVLHGTVADALIRAGSGARLLVVGDKRRGVVGRVRTGDVPGVVAAGAHCPVAVVPLHQLEGEPR
ncbi:universal stress protein [Nucisporomicrobium flavum]|uniref:universal stress protein n=1 Tax=Nucisporomicrobium flavum TaxID=2785915 RepID=UPI0018F4FB9F|nr:universal stress protein [Nucisporomicrobium flavum]